MQTKHSNKNQARIIDADLPGMNFTELSLNEIAQILKIPELVNINEGLSGAKLLTEKEKLAWFNSDLSQIFKDHYPKFETWHYPIALKVTQQELYIFELARKQLFNAMPFIKNYDDLLVKAFVPLHCEAEMTLASASLHWLPGVVFLSIPNEADRFYELAINIAHEIGHQIVMRYLTIDRILESDLNEPIYSAARKCERPAIKSFHAAVALVFELMAAKSLLESRVDFLQALNLKKLLNELRIDLKRNIFALRSQAKFTPLGLELFNEIETTFINFGGQI